ncbi:50S ribosomal protein L5 [Candidatus Peregrinibacteria bacterium]|nr:50S ribosomal protein L5 [Candidatus Peregrinibacteria bacterium]MBI3815935.1 50S ribosomal protein L5 [Candidatus Peregrinibacteria bacterium]
MAYRSLHDRLRKSIATALKKELGIANVHALPRLEKVIVNVGINKTKMDGKEIHEYVAQTLAQITGQKPVLRITRKAISNFKTRSGLVVGAMVTLRGRRMEAFVDRLVSYALPRIRDFRGLPAKFDGRGNYAIGIRDHTIFPEVPAAEAGKIFGMQIQFTTTAGRDDRGRALLKQIGMPFTPERKISAKSSSSRINEKTVEESASISHT